MTETENTCCGIPEKLAEDFGQSIYRPIIWNQEQNSLDVGPWSFRLFKTTPAGNISKKGAASALMNFCPFCGVPLTDTGKSLEEDRLSEDPQ